MNIEEQGSSKRGKEKLVSQEKLDQLANARDQSVKSRHDKLRSKLERKIDELDVLLGNLRRSQIDRIGNALIEIEQRHREKQNNLIVNLNEGLDRIMRELKLSRGNSQSVVSLSQVSSSRPENHKKSITSSGLSTVSSKDSSTAQFDRPR